jgi:hypothetical protein
MTKSSTELFTELLARCPKMTISYQMEVIDDFFTEQKVDFDYELPSRPHEPSLVDQTPAIIVRAGQKLVLTDEQQKQDAEAKARWNEACRVHLEERDRLIEGDKRKYIHMALAFIEWSPRLPESFAQWLKKEQVIYAKDYPSKELKRLNPLDDDDYDSNDDQIQDLKDALNGYLELHDGLSDMIESGRLTEIDIPDDYKWLIEKLAELANVAWEPGEDEESSCME